MQLLQNILDAICPYSFIALQRPFIVLWLVGSISPNSVNIGLTNFFRESHGPPISYSISLLCTSVFTKNISKSHRIVELFISGHFQFQARSNMCWTRGKELKVWELATMPCTSWPRFQLLTNYCAPTNSCEVTDLTLSLENTSIFSDAQTEKS